MAKKRSRREGGEEKNRSSSESDGADGRPEKEKAKADGALGAANGSLKEWAKSLVIALLLFLFLRTFLLSTFVIISGSMENTLLIGDLLLVNRAAFGSSVPGTSLRIPGYSEPKRGDILVFDPHHEEDIKLVKRLIGLPEDTLEMRSQTLFLNGKLLEEPYVKHVGNGEDLADPIMDWQRRYLAPDSDADSYEPTRDNWGPIIVPEDHYFLMGDNRDASYDSRFWGPLERWRVEGRAVLIYFSYDRQSLQAFPWLREVRWGRILDRVH